MKLIEKMSDAWCSSNYRWCTLDDAYEYGFRAAREMAIRFVENSNIGGSEYNPDMDELKNMGEQEVYEAKSGAV